jgi:hypothetical protein
MMQHVVSKIGNRLPGWKRNLLSNPSGETFVKAVLTALPTYFMIVFKLKNGPFLELINIEEASSGWVMIWIISREGIAWLTGKLACCQKN